MSTRDVPPPALTHDQGEIVERPLDAKIFLEGIAGTGKTTVGVERLLFLMANGVPADSILLVVPQRTLASPYYEALSYPGVVAGGVVGVLTVGGLARRMVDLFWPLVAEVAGFKHTDQGPVFLTLETAQYYMARLVRPLLDQGFFDSIAISRNRLYSQILDNLNKAAVVGFSYEEIGERLKSAWIGDASQGRVYDDAQESARRFRQFCLEHNLLDFSLQVEVFTRYLWTNPICREYLIKTYRHLIVDNLEEDTPIAHALLSEWLPDFQSCLLIYDLDAGYRNFLGADPQTGYALRELCAEHRTFTESFVTSGNIQVFSGHLAAAFSHHPSPSRAADMLAGDDDDLRSAIAIEYHRYYPQMLDWVVDQIASLVIEQGVPAGEIAVLAPFLSDALRYLLVDRLANLGIPARSHRPSRSLREEPAAQCLLTLAIIAHPAWTNAGASIYHPTKFDVAYAFIQAIEGMDLVRAQLLSEIVYRQREGVPTLSSFDRIKADVQERITYVLGQRYEALRIWLEDYARGPSEELDVFFSRLFGEVLSQPGYRFHQDFTAGEVAANLIESARKFRWSVGTTPIEGEKPIGQEYIEMVRDGVVAAQYVRSWQLQPAEAVMLAPAYTFLMANRPVEIQFWLDIASRGWFERLYQPVTHPFVLSRQWQAGRIWTDQDEYDSSQASLFRLTMGLLRRCRRRVYLGLTDLNEQGFEFKGPLLKSIQHILQTTAAGGADLVEIE